MFGKKKGYVIEYELHGDRYRELTSAKNPSSALKKLRRLITRNHGHAAIYITSFCEVGGGLYE